MGAGSSGDEERCGVVPFSEEVVRVAGSRPGSVPVVANAKARLSGVSDGGEVAETSGSEQPEADPDGAHAVAGDRRRGPSGSAAVAGVVMGQVIPTA